MRGAGLLTGAVKGRPGPGSFSWTPKPLSAWSGGGGSGLACGPNRGPFYFSKWQLFGRWRPPTAPSPQSTPSSAPVAPRLGGTKALAPRNGHSGSQVGFASIGSSLLGGGQARVCRVGASPSLSSGRAWGWVAAVPREFLRGLPLAWGLVGGLHLGRSPGRKKLPPGDLPVPR